jgi:PncC family amidohydrolase
MKNAAEEIVAFLKVRRKTVTFAESCTGGLACAMLVDAAGASDVLKESFVTYCDEAKHRILGVSEETLSKYTAVSEPSAREMVQGLLKQTGADYGISITGYAGPGGADAGLVYIGLGAGERTEVREFHFPGARNDVRRQAACMALSMLKERLEEDV